MAYERQYYTNGDVLDARQMNHMETGIKENSDNIDKHSEDIATKASAIKEKASGEVIVVTDSDEQKPLSLSIDGKSEQKQYSGNQLFNYSGLEQGEISQDTGANVNSGGSIYRTSEHHSCNAETKHTLSGVNNSIRFFFYDSNKGYLSTMLSGNGTFTTPANCAYFRCHATKENFSEFTMLNVGETALPWEPYVGGQPSPSPSYQQEIVNNGVYDETTGKYKVTVKGTRKNLLNVNAIKMASDALVNGLKGVINADGSITVSGTPTDTWSNISEMFNYLPFKSGKQYIFSVEKPLNEVKLGIKFATSTSDRESYRITKGSKEVSFKLTKDREYTSFFIEELVAGTEYNFTFKPMVRLAEITDDTYEPYKETTATVLLDEPLRKGDKEYWNGSKLRIDRYRAVEVLDGSKMYEKPSFANNSAFTCNTLDWNPVLVYGYDTKADLLSNALTTDAPSAIASSSINKIGQGGASGKSVYISVKDITTVAELKASLTENPILIEYPLATPITEEIDIDLGELSMFYPTTILSNDCNANMEVTYIADTKAYIDKKFAEVATAMV